MNCNRSSAIHLIVILSLSIAALMATPPASGACTDTNTCLGVDALPDNTGFENTAIGYQSLSSNTTGIFNTSLGANSLRDSVSASGNVAIGREALATNIQGGGNTAVGHRALTRNNSFDNTAVGAFALQANELGIDNTAVGFLALASNNGAFNTALGREALLSNTSGADNTAVGILALSLNDSGNSNTAVGAYSLQSATRSIRNTAVGLDAQRDNTSGSFNTSVGVGSLRSSRTGVRNVALGYRAGLAIEGSDNIVIGARTAGAAADNGIIRIGSSEFQKKTYVAGIRGVQISPSTATTVYIDAGGQLGTIKSSREFKEEIEPLGDMSERVFDLRPVSFRYLEADTDGHGPIQFGLIAEEVAEAFPELVVTDDSGKPETVAYHQLSTLLLNELQKQRAVVESQAQELAQLKADVARLINVIESLDPHVRVAGR